MCGRYTVYQTDKIKERFDVDSVPGDLRPNYNVAPGQDLPVVVEDKTRHLKVMRWGLIPFWAKDQKIGYKLINARSETIFEKPMWKGAVTKHRCLVPANGFYEWKKLDGKDKQPFYIRPKDQELFAFAGITSSWTDKETGEVIDSYSIITTSPNKEMRKIHDRMPVILKPSDESHWLDASLDKPEAIDDFLHPYKDGGLEMYEVSRDVNTPRNNSEELLYPVAQ